jgi:hypothetical protein
MLTLATLLMLATSATAAPMLKRPAKPRKAPTTSALTKCRGMLADMFPDDAPSGWTIVECTSAIVVATDRRGTTVAVDRDGNAWALLATVAK